MLNLSLNGRLQRFSGMNESVNGICENGIKRPKWKKLIDQSPNRLLLFLNLV